MGLRVWDILFPSEYYRRRGSEPSRDMVLLGFFAGLLGWWLLFIPVLHMSLIGKLVSRYPGFVSAVLGHPVLVLQAAAKWAAGIIVLSVAALLITGTRAEAKLGGGNWRMNLRRSLVFLMLNGISMLWLLGSATGLIVLSFQTGLHLFIVAAMLPIALLLAVVATAANAAAGDRLKISPNCARCGYLLINLPESTRRCPECGEVFDPQRIRKAQLQAEERP